MNGRVSDGVFPDEMPTNPKLICAHFTVQKKIQDESLAIFDPVRSTLCADVIYRPMYASYADGMHTAHFRALCATYLDCDRVQMCWHVMPLQVPTATRTPPHKAYVTLHTSVGTRIVQRPKVSVIVSSGRKSRKSKKNSTCGRSIWSTPISTPPFLKI